MEKARTLDTDAVILDLEDAVGPQEKRAARNAVEDWLAQKPAGRLAVVRINGLTSDQGVDDLRAAQGADAILLPKVDGAADLAAARLLTSSNGKTRTPLWAMIETPCAVLNLPEIAADAAALVLGANDLLKAMGGRPRADRANLHHAMGALVTAARAHDALALDAVHNDIADTGGFAAACTLARDFGFDGKCLIHPAQIEPARAAFAPTPEEIEEARALLAEFALPRNQDKGVIPFRGRMVERLHADMARRLLEEA